HRRRLANRLKMTFLEPAQQRRNVAVREVLALVIVVAQDLLLSLRELPVRAAIRLAAFRGVPASLLDPQALRDELPLRPIESLQVIEIGRRSRRRSGPVEELAEQDRDDLAGQAEKALDVIARAAVDDRRFWILEDDDIETAWIADADLVGELG